MLDGVLHVRRTIITAWSMRPIGESLETLERAPGTLKKARSKTEGEVPTPKCVGKVMP